MTVPLRRPQVSQMRIRLCAVYRGHGDRTSGAGLRAVLETPARLGVSGRETAPQHVVIVVGRSHDRPTSDRAAKRADRWSCG